MTAGRPRGAWNPAIARIAGALAAREPQVAERDEPFREAAVAIVLRARPDDDCDLLLIRRATRASDPWSGQIALPGGVYSAGDRSLEDTAVRETAEELGLDLRMYGTVLGAMDEVRPRISALPPIIIRPYVCIVESSPPLVMNDEVAEYRWVALGSVFAPEVRVQTTVEARALRMHVEALQVGDFTIWGLTERILTSLQQLAG